MKTLYGAPYMGSKTKIAHNILAKLPTGERFVDLFGGGFAMSHCALLSGRYKKVSYRDYNKLVVDLVQKAIDGEYNYSVFLPEFVSHEQFDKEKFKDGYIGYIWSFGNNPLKGYMYSHEKEPFKKIAHDFIVFGKWDDFLQEYLPQAKLIRTSDIVQRRLQLCQMAMKEKARLTSCGGNGRAVYFCEDMRELSRLERLQNLSQLERLQNLSQLERLQNLSQLERLQNLSYDQYEYQDGDVVYCDPPYEGTEDYIGSFDHNKFYDWVATRDYQVFFSSYNISDTRFKMVYAKKLNSTLGTGNNSVKYECIYTNR